MHVLIADDEAPARGELLFILEELLPEATFYEAKDGGQALTVVETEPIEVAFLDINMPVLDGLAVAEALADGPSPPIVIFATAYDAHAVEAFELAALDYVVKPFDERRLERTAERIRNALAEKTEFERSQSALRAFLADRRPGGLTRMWGERDNEARVLVDYGDIVWLEAEAKQVHMSTRSGERLRVRNSLKELEERLADNDFVRVHRAYLVNLQHVSEIQPWFSGSWMLVMDDADSTQIPMSRRYATQLKQRLDWS